MDQSLNVYTSMVSCGEWLCKSEVRGSYGADLFMFSQKGRGDMQYNYSGGEGEIRTHGTLVHTRSRRAP